MVFQAEGEQQAESLSAGRPRRSTRSTVDYANPDVATVVAEQEDLENEARFAFFYLHHPQFFAY